MTLNSAARAARDAAPARPGGRAPRRADIDGLRALAVALVVVYHVWFGRVSGGVDVFLLVSAYFLTDWFLRRARTAGLRDVPGFWIRRFTRLLPAAAVTIAGVLVFAAIALPASQWRSLWSQAWASLLYVQNRALSAAAVDYYARTETIPSPLQHFWSLSVQGQVFLLWPVIIALSLLLARRLRLRATLVLLVVFGAIFVASLAYSIWLTGSNQQVAYFSTPARLWEFALGSVAAIVLPSLRVPGWLGNAFGWMGIIALVTCGLILDVGAGFPGFAALWPTLAAVAIIAAGRSAVPTTPSRLLSARPLLWLGGIAYSLYLVHWPILIAYLVLTGTTDVDLLGGAAVIGGSVVAAWAMNRWVEGVRETASHSRAGVVRPVAAGRVVAPASLVRGARTIAAWSMIVAMPLAAWQLADQVRASTLDTTANPGAAVLMPGASLSVEPDAPLLPIGTAIDDEWVHLEEPCGAEVALSDEGLREFCTQTVVDDTAPTLLVVGDSHAQQWLGSMLPVLEQERWNVVALLKGGCALAPDEDGDDECVQWRAAAADFAADYSADIVMIVGTRMIAENAAERVPLGLDRVVNRVAASGSQVLLIRDNPRFTFDMYDCLQQSDADACERPARDQLAPENPALSLASDRNVHVLDFTEYLCPDGICPPAIGNVAVYLDDNHLTWSYARSLSPAVFAALQSIPGIPIG